MSESNTPLREHERMLVLHRRARQRCVASETLDPADPMFRRNRVEYDGIAAAIAGTPPEELELDCRHTPSMGEISGMSGQYEEICQTMLEAAVRYLHRHWDWDGEEGALDDVMWDAAKALGRGGGTGAMHVEVRGRLRYIAENGWPSYVAMCEKAEREGGERQEMER